MLVFGRLESPEAGAAVLRARGPAGDVRFELPIDPASAPSGALVATLWARRAIRDLEEGSSRLHAPRGSRQRRGRDLESRVKDEIVRLSTQYGVLSVLSRHTSWLAVEAREGAAPGEVVLLKVPSAVTRGWHGAALASPSPMQCTALRSSFDAVVCDEAFDEAPRSLPAMREWRAAADARPPMTPSPVATGPSRRASQRPLDRLVARQAADGSWGLDDALARILGLADATLPARVAALLPSVPSALRPRVFATALALLWLETHAADERDEWVLLAAKAAEWLERTARAPAAALVERLSAASHKNMDLPRT